MFVIVVVRTSKYKLDVRLTNWYLSIGPAIINTLSVLRVMDLALLPKSITTYGARTPFLHHHLDLVRSKDLDLLI